MGAVNEVLTCLEHQAIPVQPHRRPGEFSLTHAQASRLAQAKGIPADAFRWGHRCILWRQFCGIVHLDDLTLEILPKIHGKETEPGSCREVLVKMLRKAGVFKIHKGAGAGIQTQKHTMLDLFIMEFCLLVREQILRGKPRNYQSRESNLGVVKGKLLVNQQLRQNLHHQERLYCQYDELTEDILINQIVKVTLKVLLHKCRAAQTKKAITELLMQHDDIQDLKPDHNLVDRVFLDRTNQRYEPILNWCQLFLNSDNPDVAAGDHNLLAVLFDMNRLFEAWLASHLKPVARQHSLHLVEQRPQLRLANRHDLGRELFQIKPDISFINKHGQVVAIVDAKWKHLDPAETKLGISQNDLYQLVAYANRYDVDQLSLAYPRQSGMEPSYELTILGRHSVTITINTVDLNKPLEPQQFNFSGEPP